MNYFLVGCAISATGSLWVIAWSLADIARALSILASPPGA